MGRGLKVQKNAISYAEIPCTTQMRMFMSSWLCSCLWVKSKQRQWGFSELRAERQAGRHRKPMRGEHFKENNEAATTASEWLLVPFIALLTDALCVG